jgi:hypothetical protein
MKNLHYSCDCADCNHEVENLKDWLSIGSTDEESLVIINNIKASRKVISLGKNKDLHFCSVQCFQEYFFYPKGVDIKVPPQPNDRGWNISTMKQLTRESLLRAIKSEFGLGCAAICEERARQKEVKGYDIEKDKSLYSDEELAMASIAYAISPDHREVNRRHQFWPWDIKYWNATPDNRLREFEKSGALMAAQIDVSSKAK